MFYSKMFNIIPFFLIFISTINSKFYGDFLVSLNTLNKDSVYLSKNTQSSTERQTLGDSKTHEKSFIDV